MTRGGKFPAKVHCLLWCLLVRALPVDSLSVPVVDLVDVPKHNLVFSFHVVWDALLLDPLHVALPHGQRSVPPSTRSHGNQDQRRGAYLHHDAQVLDVVLLRLDQLLQHEPEHTQTGS